MNAKLEPLLEPAGQCRAGHLRVFLALLGKEVQDLRGQFVGSARAPLLGYETGQALAPEVGPLIRKNADGEERGRGRLRGWG